MARPAGPSKPPLICNEYVQHDKAYNLGWECIALCAIGGCLLVIYTPKRASNVSVPVHAQLLKVTIISWYFI